LRYDSGTAGNFFFKSPFSDSDPAGADGFLAPAGFFAPVSFFGPAGFFATAGFFLDGSDGFLASVFFTSLPGAAGFFAEASAFLAGAAAFFSAAPAAGFAPVFFSL